ncbi:MAG TPA: ABC transporter ATP-binding protein [Candidatus Lokiarchaeia archaeon]|nr:ABC transporter ATP-binding protein [Candidatus Lokiarchaeia archaeon]
MAFIELKNVRKEYEIGDYVIIALDDITISIEKNELVAIVGTSGAGKTTLLNIIGSLDKPTSGEILIENVNIAAMSEYSLASWRAINLGFIFQSFNLISTLTARENIAFPAIAWNYEQEMIVPRVDELLNLVGLQDRSDHLPIQLSAGEQQRVAIARALMNNPPIIIADEPTANLDAKTAILIFDLLIKISEMEDKTMIVATHDEKLMQMARKRFLMDSGKLNEI